jgi:hypothetical protein
MELDDESLDMNVFDKLMEGKQNEIVAEERQNHILDADYRKVEVDPFVQELAHLTEDEKQVLGKTLKKFPTLFGGGLGMLNIKPVRLELIDGAQPYHARPFHVPQLLEATTKKEVKRLTYIDVFNRSSDSEWAVPTFIQAKNIDDVRCAYPNRL